MPTKEDEIFGKIAIANNFITKDQLEKALEVVKSEEQTPEKTRKLSDVLRDQEILNIDEVLAITEAYRRRINLGEFATASIKELASRIDDIFFSKIAMLNKIVTREQLSECSKEQINTRRQGQAKKLAEIMLEKAYLADQYILAIFELQQEHRRVNDEVAISAQAYTYEEDFAFCRISLFNKVITEFQLDEVMRNQAEFREKGEEYTLTQLLINKGYVPGSAARIIMDEVTRYLS